MFGNTNISYRLNLIYKLSIITKKYKAEPTVIYTINRGLDLTEFLRLEILKKYFQCDVIKQLTKGTTNAAMLTRVPLSVFFFSKQSVLLEKNV